MSTSEAQEKPLSYKEIEKLAAGVILGSELLKEVARLERQGELFTDGQSALGDEEDARHPANVVSLLLHDPASTDPDDQLDPSETTPSLLAEALEQARQDPDFLRVRLEDFEVERDGERVQPWNRDLIGAVAEKLGYYRYEYDQPVSWPRKDYDDPFQSQLGTLRADFDERLQKQKLNWLELLRDKDKGVAKAVANQLGDPHQPQEVATSLIRRRLHRLEDELALYHTAKYERRLAREARAASKADERQVDDTWAAFSSAPPAPAVKAGKRPQLSSAEKSAPVLHPRGVAPDLGDSDLGH